MHAFPPDETRHERDTARYLPPWVSFRWRSLPGEYTHLDDHRPDTERADEPRAERMHELRRVLAYGEERGRGPEEGSVALGQWMQGRGCRKDVQEGDGEYRQQSPVRKDSVCWVGVCEGGHTGG